MSECINKLIITKIEHEIEKDKLFPNRHREIHKACCKYCPSNNNRKAGITDPETEDMKMYSKEFIAKECLFVCAWRNNKLCKGVCDDFGIDEQFLRATISATKHTTVLTPPTKQINNKE